MKCYGYVRVSSKDQNTDRQLVVMEENHIPPENIYTDKVSGKNFDRVNYQHMLHIIRPRDVIFVKSIDRLGRNYEEIIEQWRLITKEKRAEIVVTDLPLLDTRGKNERDLTGTFISDIVLQILSYVSETERMNIRKRQEEGIRIAKSKGVMFGRPSKHLPSDFELLFRRWRRKELSTKDLCQMCGMSSGSLYRKLKEEGYLLY